MDLMKSILLPNDGYVRGSLSEELFDGLLKESLDYENAEFRNTGLKNAYGEQTCPHYELSDKSRIDLMNFLSPYFQKYMEEFHYVRSLKFMTSSSPVIFGKPWFNIQSPNDFLPVHSHSGILSYTIWLKLPLLSVFTFHYSGITSNILEHHIKLTERDVGDFIFFPSTLNHSVNPYKSDDPNEIRISISGNIFFQGVDDYLSK
tara:strand:- start:641 stop:1249 length:609 start_codon:yes stop_codon:yes gene_type:complete